MRTRSILGTLAAALVVAAALIFGGAAPSAQAQRPPALSSEEMLRLVLPTDAAGQRPGVLAWARYDDLSPRDGSPVIFVALLYETPAPFDRIDVRRLVNRIQWNGRAYEIERADEPGEVLDGEMAWLGLPRWSVEIDVTGNGSEGNPIYTVTYKGQGALDSGLEGALTLTELFRPSADLLWRRITELREVDRIQNLDPARAISVRYRMESTAEGVEQLIAFVSETRIYPPAPNTRAAPFIEQQEFEELYALDNGRFTLVSRTPVASR